MTLSLTGRWPKYAVPLRYAARRTGDWSGHLTVVFASPLSRLRSTHDYAPATAYAALLCW
ncbi:MAG: hypothetical protein IKP00_13510 [Victivallales bacterium]|nr:hypothetical protein [Victivallales bacterium]